MSVLCTVTSQFDGRARLSRFLWEKSERYVHFQFGPWQSAIAHFVSNIHYLALQCVVVWNGFVSIFQSLNKSEQVSFHQPSFCRFPFIPHALCSCLISFRIVTLISWCPKSKYNYYTMFAHRSRYQQLSHESHSYHTKSGRRFRSVAADDLDAAIWCEPLIMRPNNNHRFYDSLQSIFYGKLKTWHIFIDFAFNWWARAHQKTE